MTKTQTPAKLLLRYLWPRMQRGERHFVIEDTQLAFSQTAQQLSKAVRRFNESGHELNWPGFHFSAKVLDVYKLEIKAEREADPVASFDGRIAISQSPTSAHSQCASSTTRTQPASQTRSGSTRQCSPPRGRAQTLPPLTA